MFVFVVKLFVFINLIKYYVVDIGLLIVCGGVVVYFGDIFMGDGDGVMVILCYLVDVIVVEIVVMELFEVFVLEEVVNGVLICGLYLVIDFKMQVCFEEWKVQNDV